jgi:hypothetical protein
MCCNKRVPTESQVAGIRRVCTHDDKFWDGDDDTDGVRKLELIRQTKLEIVAPFHPVFMPVRKVKVRRPASD